MTIASYAELVSELGDWLNRTDLSAKIPTFIRLFEARMNRRLRAPDMEQTFTLTTVAGTLSYALNARVRSLREVYIETSADIDATAYTVTGESIVFNDDPGEVTLVYTAYSTLPALGTGQATNWLLDDHPDLYLFGSLARAEAYLKDDDRLAVWKSAEDEALSEVIREANEKRLPAGPLQMQPSVIE